MHSRIQILPMPGAMPERHLNLVKSHAPAVMLCF